MNLSERVFVTAVAPNENAGRGRGAGRRRGGGQRRLKPEETDGVGRVGSQNHLFEARRGGVKRIGGVHPHLRRNT